MDGRFADSKSKVILWVEHMRMQAYNYSRLSFSQEELSPKNYIYRDVQTPPIMGGGESKKKPGWLSAAAKLYSKKKLGYFWLMFLYGCHNNTLELYT